MCAFFVWSLSAGNIVFRDFFLSFASYLIWQFWSLGNTRIDGQLLHFQAHDHLMIRVLNIARLMLFLSDLVYTESCIGPTSSCSFRQQNSHVAVFSTTTFSSS